MDFIFIFIYIKIRNLNILFSILIIYIINYIIIFDLTIGQSERKLNDLIVEIYLRNSSVFVLKESNPFFLRRIIVSNIH